MCDRHENLLNDKVSFDVFNEEVFNLKQLLFKPGKKGVPVSGAELLATQINMQKGGSSGGGGLTAQ